MACRVEEIPNVGDFVTYDIVNDSVIVVRTSATDIVAYVNSCLHRGTALCDGNGDGQEAGAMRGAGGGLARVGPADVSHASCARRAR